jgi:nucleoside phosphorylase
MGGIAAGIKTKGNFGDILIADLSWDYGSGKMTTNREGEFVFKQDPRPLSLNPQLNVYVHKEELKNQICKLIEEKWTTSSNGVIDSRLKIVIGPIASGSYVIENIRKVQEVIDQQRKLIGIDMETYAVFYSAAYSTDPKPYAMSVKSICDYGDINKDDRYQQYAAFTSSNFIYNFALKYL